MADKVVEEKVVKEGGYMSGWESIKPVCLKFANLLGVEIEVSYPEVPTPPNTESGKLFLRLFSTSTAGSVLPNSEANEGSGSVFGIDYNEAFPPSMVGIKIADSDGEVAAEVVGGTLYVLCNLSDSDSPGALLNAILSEYALSVPRSLKARKAFTKEAREKLVTESPQNFLEFFANRRGKDRDDQVRKQFATLSNMAKGGELLVLKEEIRLPVGKITMNQQGDRSDIGRWLLTINPYGSQYDVRFICLNPEEAEEEHPFLDSSEDSNACLGNIAEGLHNYIAARRFDLAFFLMLRFLQTGGEQ